MYWMGGDTHPHTSSHPPPAPSRPLFRFRVRCSVMKRPASKSSGGSGAVKSDEPYSESDLSWGGGVDYACDRLLVTGGLHFTPVDMKSSEGQALARYAQSDHLVVPSAPVCDVLGFCRVERSAELISPFESGGFNRSSDRRLLWFGTRMTNWTSILVHGIPLRASSEFDAARFFEFGRSIVLTDCMLQAVGAADIHGRTTIIVLALCEVAMSADRLETAFVAGGFQPDPKESVTLDSGCVIPCGRFQPNPNFTIAQTSQYAVANPARVCIRYLAHVRVTNQNYR